MRKVYTYIKNHMISIFRILTIIYISIVCIFFYIIPTYAAINFTVTPIRYEFQIEPGESITATASIRNNGSSTVTLWTTASDFESRDYSWTPKIVRRSELVFPDQQLSSWITLSDVSITLDAGEKKTIEFTIDVPADATPWWRYGAVLFKHDGSQTSSGWNIWIDVDYGIIILLEVAWDIVIDIEIEDPIIQNNFWYGVGAYGPDSPIWNIVTPEDPEDSGWFVWSDEDGSPLFQLPDDCPFWDLSGDRFDGRCYPWEPPLFQDDEPILFWDDFKVQFSFPISNKGNIHVRPTGKITLRDEDWDIIQGIWKEVVANEYGATIGERVVDYIPINDEQGNVLPGSRRIFDVYWRGFPYQSYDDLWNIIMKYWNPSDFYTRFKKRESGYLMPWEIVTQDRTRKNITAEIELRYKDTDGNDVTFHSVKEFPIQYVREKIILNPYIIIWFAFLIPIILMLIWAAWWWIIIKRQKKCWNCKKKIKAHWETCPYCEAIQDKKKHKRFQEMIENKNNKKKKLS